MAIGEEELFFSLTHHSNTPLLQLAPEFICMCLNATIY